jgi:hypothetical protein
MALIRAMLKTMMQSATIGFFLLLARGNLPHPDLPRLFQPLVNLFREFRGPATFTIKLDEKGAKSISQSQIQHKAEPRQGVR